MLKLGDCLLFKTNFDEFGFIQNHLFIIVLEPQGITQNIIIVNIDKHTSPKQDQTTILQPGDHDFINLQSYVNYGRAKIISYDKLEEYVRRGEARLYPPLENILLQRVCEGILRSRFTPIEVRELYQDSLYNQI